MADHRRTSRQSRDPGWRPTTTSSNGQGSLKYGPVLAGVVACSRCAALVLDTPTAQGSHGAFHDGLRELWRRVP
jgi:hypothetical protein